MALNEKEFERVINTVTKQLQLFAENIGKNSGHQKKSSDSINDLTDANINANKLIKKEIAILSKRIELNQSEGRWTEGYLKRKNELERQLLETQEAELDNLKDKIKEDDRRSCLQEKWDKRKAGRVDEEILQTQKFITSNKQLLETIKIHQDKVFNTMNKIVKDFGLIVPEKMKSSTKDLREIFDETLLLEQEKNELLRKRILNDKENWHLQSTYTGRLGALVRSIGDSAKDVFLNKTGVLGGAVKLFGKVRGKSWGTGADDSKEMRMRMQLAELKSNERMKESSDKIKTKSILTENDPEKISMFGKFKNLFESKPKSNVEVGGMRQDKNTLLEESKEQTGLLKKILKSSTSSKGAGLLGLLSMLGAIGGLVGFALTGKSEFLGDMIKGLVKSGALVSKMFTTALSIPAKLLSKIGFDIGEKLLAPFKVVDKFFSKGLATFFFKKAKGLTGVLKGMSKLGGVFGKIAGFGAKAAGTVAKGFGMAALKKIPVLGLLISLPLAINRWKKGDYVGALLELGSGVASLFPGIGTAISIGLDLINVGRDLFGNKDAIKEGAGEKFGGKKSTASGKGFFSGLFGSDSDKEAVASNTMRDEETGEIVNKATTNQENSNVVVNSPKQVKKYIPPSSRSGANEQISVIKLHPDSIKQVVEGMGKEYGKENGKTSQSFSNGGPSFGFNR